MQAADPEAADRLSELTPARPVLVTFGSITEPDGGLQVRSRLLAESLAKLGMPPTVVSTREPADADLSPWWARRIAVPSRPPRRGFSMEWAQLIREVARDGDFMIVANAMFMPALAVSRVRLPVVWDTNECQTLHYRRLHNGASTLLKLGIWFGLERWAAARCQVAVSIGESEAVEWRHIHPLLRDKVMTVDHAAFFHGVGPGGDGELERVLGGPVTHPLLLFVGTMTAKHNAAAARWLIEELAPALPDSVTLALCGPGSDKLPGSGRPGARVALLGAVADIDSVIAAADLCLAPLAAGAGVKTKVLHYLAHGRLVAGTPVAFEGLDGAPGLESAPMEDLTGLVQRLLANPESPGAAADRAAAQREWLREQHGRERIVGQWQDVLASIRT